jgi:hypothetical protein
MPGALSEPPATKASLRFFHREQSMDEQELERNIEPLRARLLRHPIYAAVKDLRALRIFMSSHVFAVWDFMTLVKTLQRFLTCVDTPWRPPEHPRAARLINAIVLSEESDEVTDGVFTSHFDLYLSAMDEVGADRRAIDDFVRRVERAGSWREPLESAQILPSTRAFVQTTLETCETGRVHEAVAAFLHGREDPIPRMFRRILETLDGQSSMSADAFRLYLDRHVEVDERDHAPMAHELLRTLCADDGRRWVQAMGAARAAIRARLHLWDGVLEEIHRHADTAPTPSALARPNIHAATS